MFTLVAIAHATGRRPPGGHRPAPRTDFSWKSANLFYLFGGPRERQKKVSSSSNRSARRVPTSHLGLVIACRFLDLAPKRSKVNRKRASQLPAPGSRRPVFSKFKARHPDQARGGPNFFSHAADRLRRRLMTARRPQPGGRAAPPPAGPVTGASKSSRAHPDCRPLCTCNLRAPVVVRAWPARRAHSAAPQRS